jgi:hypothetical protein
MDKYLAMFLCNDMGELRFRCQTTPTLGARHMDVGDCDDDEFRVVVVCTSGRVGLYTIEGQPSLPTNGRRPGGTCWLYPSVMRTE